jgi:hypothetical protein
MNTSEQIENAEALLRASIIAAYERGAKVTRNVAMWLDRHVDGSPMRCCAVGAMAYDDRSDAPERIACRLLGIDEDDALSIANGWDGVKMSDREAESTLGLWHATPPAGT